MSQNIVTYFVFAIGKAKEKKTVKDAHKEMVLFDFHSIWWIYISMFVG